MCLWAISVILLWIRPRIELFWKIVATVLFAFYCWFFYDDILTGFASFTDSWYSAVILFFKEALTLVFVNMFFLWPVVLVVIFYKSDDIGAEKLLRFMCILTLVLWVLFIVYYYFSAGIDSFFYDNLRKMIPHAD